MAKNKRLIPLKKLEDYTPAEARVLVAKDVLKAIEAEEMTAQPGTYASLLWVESMEELNAEPGDDLRKVIGRKPCQVCAVGAAAIGIVRRFNGVQVRGTYEEPWGGDAHSIANRLFPIEMRAEMEAAFEGDETREAAFQLGAKHVDDNERLKAIFQNIIDNDGDFVP